MSDENVTLSHCFHSLPSPDSSDYAAKVRAALRSSEPPVEELLRIIERDSDRMMRFAAYYGLLITYWRRRDFSQYRDLVDRLGGQFFDIKLSLAIRAQYQWSTAATPTNLELARSIASEAARGLPDAPNVLHLYAELVAACAENTEASTHPDGPAALLMIDRAIALASVPYPKYFATRARLLSAQGWYSEARVALRHAIEQEDSAGPDYGRRIAEYEDVGSRIAFAERMQALDRRQAAMLLQLDESSGKMIELLGLLSAIIAFLLTGTQLAREFPYEQALLLLLASAGGILVVFSGFSVLFFSRKVRWRQLLVLLLGLSISLGALYAGSLMKPRRTIVPAATSVPKK
jgi:hypothetical protein